MFHATKIPVEVGKLVTRDTVWLGGTPCWVDLSVDDIERAIAFYSGLFGWDIQHGPPEAGGYSMCVADGRQVAGIGPKFGPPGQPSAWTTYLATADADDTADKIKAAGGQVLMGPMDVMDAGRMVIASDTAGAMFGLWQGRKHTGVGLANEPGSLCWNEQMSRDFEGSKAFYAAVFGYDYGDMSSADFRYATFKVDDHEVGGIGEFPAGTPAEVPPGWPVYFAVADADATVASAVDHGGIVLRPAWDSPYGRMAAVADDQGAAFSLIGVGPVS
jgi:predicted enzyme related to lactoylglutathione lyase